jgi:hypothetical protein
MTLDEMWARLAQHQPYADANGYGPAWATMCKKQTAKAAKAACAAADAVDAVDAANAAWGAADAVDDAAAAIRYIENADAMLKAREAE